MKSGYCFDDFCTDSEVCTISPGEHSNPKGYNNIAADEGTATLQYDPDAGTSGFKWSENYGGIYATDSGAQGATLSPNLGSAKTDLTLAILLKHDVQETYSSQEVFQQNSLVVSRYK